ncbi:MAG: endo-alpha-N-acetylgalactosaminidase family protein [Bacteroides sp.]|nr:endo-alpha-N-acetylgalactosaminidase family protein [Bacteroides sp.]MCM1096146.1 endo-alpha-N-acetylgalactosaminidase family protein [Terasakiella sp.]
MKNTHTLIVAAVTLAAATGGARADVTRITVDGADGSTTVFNADEVDRVVVEQRSRQYTMERVTDKRAWHVLYGSIAMPYYKDSHTERDGYFASAFDNKIDDQGWMSHVADTYSRSQGLGDPYIVVDLGTEYPIARIGIRTGDTDGGAYDVIPRHADIYYTDENPAYPFTREIRLVDKDRSIWQRIDGKVVRQERKYTDEELASGANCYTDFDLLSGRNIRGLSEEGILVPEYLDLARRLREHDATITWHKLAAIDLSGRNPDGANSYMAIPDDVDDPGSSVTRVRYIKVVLKPYTKGSNPELEIDPVYDPDDPDFDFIYKADRTKINEIRIDRLTSVDGTAVPFEPAGAESYDDISGEPYDCTAHIAEDGSYLPERPYIHQYNRSMMLKFYMAEPDRAAGSSKVYMTFARALDNIRKLDRVTLGLHKIVYLVGWNSQGHDDRFPTVDRLNEALRRPEDSSARESLEWLRHEAAKYNTTVSVHVPLFDAYANSPDWYSYLSRDLLCREADGSLIVPGTLMGRDLHRVNIVKEWESGYLRRRIESMVDMCGIAEAGTVHLDAFLPPVSPYHGVSADDSRRVMRRIVRLLRDMGIDTTVEFYTPGDDTSDGMYGLIPAAWWDARSFEARCRGGYTHALACGGMSGYIGERYADAGFLLGDNMSGEEIFKDAVDHGLSDEEVWARVRHDFCTTTLPAMLLWDLKIQDYALHVDGRSRVNYSNGIVAEWDDNTSTGTIHTAGGDLIYRDGDNLLCPMTWDDGDFIAYSRDGYDSRTWTLDRGWLQGATSLDVTEITSEGPVDRGQISCEDGRVTLSLSPRQMLRLSPRR